ncbi:MAG: ssDNA-binding domain-containing protein, partial [Planctomycetota bacterium]|nr:ssDNA-binding domain-containing protein [Planctomycetota bacterium]
MPVQTRKPFHRQVVDKLIEQIEAGTAPWQKPWVPGRSIMPVNPTTGKQYRGVNVLMLMLQNHDDNRWLTYNQARKAGYQVRKGEHGTPVQYWVFSERIPKLDPVTGQPELDAKGNPVKVEVDLEKPKVIISRVFNASQIDGIPPQEREKGFAWDPHQRAEDMLQNSGVPIIHDQRDRAFYSPRRDEIHLPPRDRFPDAERFYDAALHEYAHATGHQSRLNRETLTKNGQVEYAREELVAQIAS